MEIVFGLFRDEVMRTKSPSSSSVTFSSSWSESEPGGRRYWAGCGGRIDIGIGIFFVPFVRGWWRWWWWWKDEAPVVLKGKSYVVTKKERDRGSFLYAKPQEGGKRTNP